LDLFSRIRPLISLLIVIVYIELGVLKSAFQASVTSLEQNGLLLPTPHNLLEGAASVTERAFITTATL